jgi:hypothetical protein
MPRNSNRSRSARKSSLDRSKNPSEHPDFPLRKHKGTQSWIKKINGHVYYFGRISNDPTGTAALDSTNAKSMTSGPGASHEKSLTTQSRSRHCASSSSDTMKSFATMAS